MNADSPQLATEVIKRLTQFWSEERARELWEAINHTGGIEELISRAMDQAFRENTAAIHGASAETTTKPTPGSPSASIKLSQDGDRTQAQEHARTQYRDAETENSQNNTWSLEDQEDAEEPNWESEVEEISIEELFNFDRNNDPDNLLGNRWLCRGDTCVIQGETGIGKSTLIMQAIISWAIAELFFGIKAKHTLKSLLIESENNKGDLAEVFQDVVKAMDLRPDQIAYLKTKIVIVRECAKTGRAFLKLARRLIKKHNPDLVFADPLLSYLGDNASDQKAMSVFLRNGLQPIVQASKVIWFWVHHFSKPPRDDKPATRRSVYAGMGSVEIPGWARETITINTINEEERFCEIQFGKRARRVGLADANGQPVFKLCIQQSKAGVLWELVDQDAVKSTIGAAAHHRKSVAEIRGFIEKKVNVTHPQLEAFAKQIEIGEKRAVNIARALVDDAEEPRVYEYRIKGRTKGKLAFSTVTRDLNPLAFASAPKTRKKNPKKGSEIGATP